MRRRLVIVCLFSALSLLTPTGSRADHQVLAIRFDGEITLWTSLACAADSSSTGCQSAELWAPVAPADACDPLCPEPSARLVYWGLGESEVPTAGVSCTALTDRGFQSCALDAEGSIHLSGNLVPGPYCYSGHQGTASFHLTVGGETMDMTGLPVTIVHTFPTLNWRLNAGNTTSGGGVGSMTITEPEGWCGLDPGDPRPMTRGEVAGDLVWAGR